MKRQLYTKQNEHAERLAHALDAHRAALDASSTGTGKTLVAAELAANSTCPTLVVCLKNSIPMWEAELADREANVLGVINYDMLRTGKTKWGHWIPNTRLFQFDLPAGALIIWDEVQKCQGIDTKNSKTLIAAKPFRNLLLSATAVENPSEMRALGYILGLHSLKDFVPWCKSQGCKMNQWRGWDFYDPSGQILNALHHKIFPEHGSRLTVTDLAEHFQETQIITTPLDFGPEIKNIYDQMEAELAVLSETASSDSKHPAAARLIARLRARQRAELCKVPVMTEMAEDLLKEGRSVVLFVNFDATINSLSKRLPAEIIRGGQSQTERARVMAAFQADTCRLLICNIQAGGVSINLHDLHGKHPRTSIISPSDNPKDVLQAIGRIHRAGGKTPSQQHCVFDTHSIEATVEAQCREKLRNIDRFNTGLTPAHSNDNSITRAAPRNVALAGNTNQKSNFTKAKILGTAYDTNVTPANINITESTSTKHKPIIDAGSTELSPKITKEFLTHKTDCAQSVNSPKRLNKGTPPGLCVSTTATKPETGADCSAPNATTSSGTPTTAPRFFEPPQIISKNIDDAPPISDDKTPVTEEKTQHAQFNPSSLGMFEQCPGFRNREGTNEQAEMGTRSHKALEKDAVETLPEKERPMAQVCKDYIDDLMQQRLPAVPDRDLREVRLSIDLGGGIKTFGTCDRLLVYGTHGEMLDFKFGRLSITDAEFNAQAWAYVIGAFQRESLKLETLTFTFLIPYQDELSSHTFKRSDLPAMILRLNTVIRRAMEVGDDLQGNFTLLNPQPELCEYCAQQARCPAIAARALKLAQTVGGGLPVPEKMTVSADRPEDIPHLLRLAPIMQNWAEQVKADALKVNLEEGLEIPGFVRQERSTPRSITSVLGAWDVAKDQGVDIEDFLRACSGISIVDLENAVAAIAPNRGKGKARQKLENELRAADLLREQSTYHYLREKKT